MKKQINLIPSEMTVPVKTLRLVSLLNKISTITVIFLILAIVSLIGVLVFYNLEYKQTLSNIDSLKAKVTSLESSEQKLILAKDKLGKINTVRKFKSIDKTIIGFRNFENQLLGSSSSRFSEISIDSEKIETSITSSDSTSLSNMLSLLSNLAKNEDFGYKRVIMSSLGFNSSSGYLVSLILEN